MTETTAVVVEVATGKGRESVKEDCTTRLKQLGDYVANITFPRSRFQDHVEGQIHSPTQIQHCSEVNKYLGDEVGGEVWGEQRDDSLIGTISMH